MFTNLNDFVTGDDIDDLGLYSRKKVIAQFQKVSYNKNFSLQDHGKCNENDTIQKRMKFRLNVIDLRGPIPHNV